MVASMALKRGPAEGEVRMTFDMPEELRRRLKMLAASHDVLMKDLILRWVRQGIEGLEAKASDNPSSKPR